MNSNNLFSLHFKNRIPTEYKEEFNHKFQKEISVRVSKTMLVVAIIEFIFIMIDIIKYWDVDSFPIVVTQLMFARVSMLITFVVYALVLKWNSNKSKSNQTNLEFTAIALFFIGTVTTYIIQANSHDVSIFAFFSITLFVLYPTNNKLIYLNSLVALIVLNILIVDTYGIERPIQMLIQYTSINLLMAWFLGYLSFKWNVENFLAQKEIQNNNQKLIISIDKRKALDNEKNEFLGIAAHDLKNPLNSIKMASNLLLNTPEITKEEAIELASDIQKNSNNMFELITNLLDVNKIEEGKIKVYLTNVNVEFIVKSLISNYQRAAKNKNILLEFNNQIDSIQAHTDPSVLNQILDNLLSNAIKFSPFDKKICISIKQSSDNMLISILDQGPGISEDDKNKMFGKFARLTAQPTGNEHSTGLGLSIVHKLVKLIGSEIWCESEYGRGAEFIVKLPIAKVDELV